MLLKKIVELDKNDYIDELIKMGYHKTSDGKQLYELTHSEVKALYENQKRRMEVEDESN